MPAQQDTLQEVFGVEREISGKLAAERQRAEAWLAQAREETLQARLAELERLRVRTAQEEAVATQAAQDRAAGILRQARAALERVRVLDDAQLAPIVRQRLAAILPGSTG